MGPPGAGPGSWVHGQDPGPAIPIDNPTIIMDNLLVLTEFLS